MLRRLFLGCLAIGLSLSSQGVAIAKDADSKDLVQTALNAGTFKTLAAALQAAGLVETLQSKCPFTVFAPTDEAFAKLPEGTVAKLLKPENKQQLIAVLTYHVVPGKVMAADVVKLNGAVTVNGQRVDIKVTDGKVVIDQAEVVTADIGCSNGVIHIIDQVVLPATESIPATAERAGTFTTLLAAAKAAGLVEVLTTKGPLTVFAPTDEAFAKLPAGTVESLLKPENQEMLAAILKFHVVPGRIYSNQVLSSKELKTVQGNSLLLTMKNGNPAINGAALVATDIDAVNGVIHVIDAVMLPPAAQPKKAQLMPADLHYVSTGCHSHVRIVKYRTRGARCR